MLHSTCICKSVEPTPKCTPTSSSDLHPILFSITCQTCTWHITSQGTKGHTLDSSKIKVCEKICPVHFEEDIFSILTFSLLFSWKQRVLWCCLWSPEHTLIHKPPSCHPDSAQVAGYLSLGPLSYSRVKNNYSII